MQEPQKTLQAIVAMQHLQQEARQLALKANTLAEELRLDEIYNSIDTEIGWLDLTLEVAGLKLFNQIAYWEEALSKLAKGVV